MRVRARARTYARMRLSARASLCAYASLSLWLYTCMRLARLCICLSVFMWCDFTCIVSRFRPDIVHVANDVRGPRINLAERELNAASDPREPSKLSPKLLGRGEQLGGLGSIPSDDVRSLRTMLGGFGESSPNVARTLRPMLGGAWKNTC